MCISVYQFPVDNNQLVIKPNYKDGLKMFYLQQFDIDLVHSMNFVFRKHIHQEQFGPLF